MFFCRNLVRSENPHIVFTLYQYYTNAENKPLDLDFKNFCRKLLKFSSKTGLDFTDKEVFIKSRHDRRYLKKDRDYFSIHYLLDHLSGKRTYALRRFEHSKVYIIDIDLRSQTQHKDLNKITEQLELDLGKAFYTEERLNEGFHLYYEFDNYVSSKAWKLLEATYLQKYNMAIEIKCNNEIMRLPLSFDYTLRSSKYRKSLTPNQCLTTFLRHVVTKVPSILQVSNTSENTLRISTKDSKENTQTSTQIDFSYGCGTRLEHQIPIGFNLLNKNNNATYETYVEECELWNDGTSKDMNLSDNQKHKILDKQWNWITNKFNSNYSTHKSDSEISFNNFHDNTNIYKDFTIDEDFEFSDTEHVRLEKFIKQNYKKLKIGKIGGKSEAKFIMNSFLILEFLYSTRQFRQDQEYEYIDEDFHFLNEGVPFGVKLRDTLAQYHQITNIKKILKFLIDTELLILLKDKDGFSYSYKGNSYTKHYILNDLIFRDSIYNKYLYGFSGHPYAGSVNINNVVNFFQSSDKSLLDLGGIGLSERLQLIQKMKNSIQMEKMQL